MKHFSIVIYVLAALVVGCGAGPSEVEVRKALHRQTEALLGKALAASRRKEVDAVKVIGCTKAERSGYVCDWIGPAGGGSSRVVEWENGWVWVGNGEK